MPIKLDEYIINIRRHLHKNPELSRCEFKTADYILEQLQKLNIPAKKLVGGTGVVGLLEGRSQKTVALRADTDALPITEENDIEYKSQNAGIMHACGHDCHTAIILGTAKILSEKKDKLNGNVKFIFQPDEELSDGARGMIKDDVMNSPKVDVVLGTHVCELIDSGKIGIKFGPMMASVDRLHIKIEGLMSHGASPHAGIDPLPAAADFILSAQTIVARQIDPLEPAVVTFGKISGGTNYNIIAKEVIIDGTVRTLNESVRAKIKKNLINKLKALELAYNVKTSIDYIDNTNSLINDKEIAQFCVDTACEFYGKDNVVLIERPTMGGEDFSQYLKYAPGNFMFIGTRKDENSSYNIHHPRFNVDESALPKAAQYLAFTAEKILEK